MGRFYLSYVEQENLLPRSFPPEIPNKTPFPLLLLIRFHKKTIPLADHNYIAFTQIAARGWPFYVPRSKDRLPLKELSINSLSWSGPADSHFVHSFFHKCIVFIYQPGWLSSVGTWFEWGGLYTKSRMSGKSRAPYDIQEPSRKLDH